MKRKKSILKLTFRPELNEMSRKIVERKMNDIQTFRITSQEKTTRLKKNWKEKHHWGFLPYKIVTSRWKSVVGTIKYLRKRWNLLKKKSIKKISHETVINIEIAVKLHI